MSVVSLQAEREARDPHLQGKARCIACEHEWQAVAAIGTVWMECPACGTGKGLFVHPCEPEDGGKLWECLCVCTIFYMTPKAIHCCQCGYAQHGMWD